MDDQNTPNDGAHLRVFEAGSGQTQTAPSESLCRQACQLAAAANQPLWLLIFNRVAAGPLIGRPPFCGIPCEEADQLLVLPDQPYEAPQWKQCTVHWDCHLILDKCYYLQAVRPHLAGRREKHRTLALPPAGPGPGTAQIAALPILWTGKRL